jgi:hypothetical protein
MFRLDLTLFNQMRTQVTKVNNADAGELKKIHQLFTLIAHGFDPSQPPASVLLYREGVRLYQNGHYSSSKLVFEDALSKAEEEDCSYETISLYKAQITKVQEYIKSREKTTKYSWWKTIIPLLGSSSSISLAAGFYLGRMKPSPLIP